MQNQPTACFVSLLALSVGTALLLGQPSARADAEKADAPTPNPVLAQQGAQHYARYCASCHGMEGRGDGPAAEALSTAPADLTKIAARRDGVFPSAEIRYHIDGRYEHAAHGTREMPVWGERFSEEIASSQVRDEIVRGRLYTLVDYLQTLQDPPPTKVE